MASTVRLDSACYLCTIACLERIQQGPSRHLAGLIFQALQCASCVASEAGPMYSSHEAGLLQTAVDLADQHWPAARREQSPVYQTAVANLRSPWPTDAINAALDSVAFHAIHQPKYNRKVLMPHLAELPDDPYIAGHVLFAAGYKRTALHKVCKPSQIQVFAELPASRRPYSNMTGFTGMELFRAATVLKLCGFVVLKDIFPGAFIAELREAHEAHFDMFSQQTLEPMADVLDSAYTHEGVDFALRSPRRLEVKLPPSMPWIDDRLIRNAYARAVVTVVMGDHRLELDTFSYLTSLPGAPVQHWHEDAGQVFSNLAPEALPMSPGQAFADAEHPLLGPRDLHLALPPHGVVMFVPLINVTRVHGPTQFIAGSHLQCGVQDKRPVVVDHVQLILCPLAMAEERQVFQPAPAAGDMVLFDFRSTHRGGGNQHATQARPFIYGTWMLEWYRDAVNFHTRHTRDFDKLSARQKKTLTRVDTLEYDAQLRQAISADECAQHRVPESEYGYDVYTYDAHSAA